jgi:antibiotic biosynthesis monooxygenase (ABM) superfamily enzyme
MEEDYRRWASRMQQAQSRFPGYRGTYFQPPSAGGSHWITMLRFGTSDQMNAWMSAPERAALIEEARPFLQGEEFLRLATSFPGWVRLDPATGKGPPNWKTALLVLLGLYPIVALELLYLNPLLKGLVPALGIFIGNVLSVAATSFLTMPFLVRRFDWWLFPDAGRDDRATMKGLGILAALFTIEILSFVPLFS